MWTQVVPFGEMCLGLLSLNSLTIILASQASFRFNNIRRGQSIISPVTIKLAFSLPNPMS